MDLKLLNASSAFLFYNDSGNALSSGTTSGFLGHAFAPDSPFLAFSGDISYPDNISIIQSGETSMVPVPGALFLFGSGMIAIAGIRRKKK